MNELRSSQEVTSDPPRRASYVRRVTSWGGHKQSALRLAERGLEAFEAGLGPELAGVVVILKGRRSLWQLEPLRFPSGVDVHVGLQGAGLVERSDAHEPDIGPASVVAPDRGLTHGAAVDVVRTALARHRNGYRLAAEQLDRLRLDDRVEYRTRCPSAAGSRRNDSSGRTLACRGAGSVRIRRRSRR